MKRRVLPTDKRMIFWCVFLTFWACLGFVQVGHTDSDKSLSVCLIRWPVYSPSKPHLRANGIIVKIINKISVELGLKPKYHYLNSGRCRSGMVSGKFDIYPYGGQHSKGKFRQGSKNILISQHSVFYQLPGFVVKKDSPLKQYLGAQQLHNKMVGMMRGDVTFPNLPAEVTLNYQVANSIRSLTKMLHSGRIDTATADYLTFIAQSPEATRQLRFLLPPFMVKKRYFLFSQGNSVLKQQVDQQLKKLLDSGFIDKIYLERTGWDFKKIQSFARATATQEKG